MPKQTTILIIILAIVTGILIFLAVTNQNLKFANQTPQSNTPTPTPIKKTAKVFFSPATVQVAAGSQLTSVDLMVDTGGSQIAGVQAELQYDATAISGVKIMPAVDETSFFGSGATILFNDVKPATGRISYVVAISPGQPGKAGVGKIGTLVFEKGTNPTTLSTSIKFLDKTLVTMLNVNESVLSTTTPLNITFTQGAPRNIPVSVIPSTAIVH